MKTRVRSPTRSARPPWRGRAGQAAPSARRVGLPGRLMLAMERLQRCAPARFALLASNTAFVISSTNSGMPSVRSMMSCRMFAGSALLPMTRSIIASDFALCQPIKCEGGHMRPSDPGRLELWPKRHDQEHAKCRLSCQRCDRTVRGLSGRSNAHPQRSSATDFGATGRRVCETSASSVLCLRCCGVSSSVG